jgi:CRISPR-associated endonuclease/helicase Cas3
MYQYWGKSCQRDKEGGDDYHLLCWHSLDVAACGYWMVRKNLFGIADLFLQSGIEDNEHAAQFFAWILCWHDIGKFADSFQQLYRNGNLSVANNHLREYEKIPHTSLGFWLWNHYLNEFPELLPPSALPPRKLKRAVALWMPLATGHHGRPPVPLQDLNNFRLQDKDAARDFLLAIRPLFPLIEVPACWDDDEGIELFNHFSWFISAVVVLADWTGSSTRFFPRQAAEMPVDQYWQQASRQARIAMSFFPPTPIVAEFSGITSLFPFIQHPTPLQQKALDLDINQHGAQLFLLEDVTGAGKTEAALTLAHRLMASGKAQGIYFGLPTMATANAMYERMAKTWLMLYQPDSRPSLVLAHSARRLMDRFNHSIWSDDLTGSEEPDENQPFAQGCAAWFADSNKKALLADIGVGTLDQAMMSIMPFKHNNLRLLGLRNKVLIADEIHAYDAYMSKILECVIEKQAQDGNTTILLSATLSQQQRDRLISAYARGAKRQIQAPQLGYGDYPWVTHVSGNTLISQHVHSRKEVERSVNIGWLHHEYACIQRIEKAVSEGKCIAWIRNSVDDAIRSFRQLLTGGVVSSDELMLFHSRFAFYDRQRIENQTLELFGKSGRVQRGGKVIIATQVIEQSLDIDLDEMISDHGECTSTSSRSARHLVT